MCTCTVCKLTVVSAGGASETLARKKEEAVIVDERADEPPLRGRVKVPVLLMMLLVPVRPDRREPERALFVSRTLPLRADSEADDGRPDKEADGVRERDALELDESRTEALPVRDDTIVRSDAITDAASAPPCKAVALGARAAGTAFARSIGFNVAPPRGARLATLPIGSSGDEELCARRTGTRVRD